MNLFRSFFHLR